jgi:hypothetical protein
MMILFLAAITASAQAPNGLGIGQAMKQNAEELKHYSYKRRTEIKAKDRAFARVDWVRYVDGKMETIPIETPQRPSPSATPRGCVARSSKRKWPRKRKR